MDIIWLILLLGTVNGAPTSTVTRNWGSCDDGTEVWSGSREVLTYQYTGEVESGAVTGNKTTHGSGFTFQCTLHIHPLQQCQRLLKIASCQYREGQNVDTWEDFSSVMNQYDVRFTVSGGLIDNIIYVHPDETTIALNIKRGMLSVLQFPKDIQAQGTFQINTVQGLCRTQVIGTSSLEGPVLSKTGCSSAFTLGQVMPLSLASQSTLLQVINPRNVTRECYTAFDNEDRLNEVNCKEKFTFESLGLQSQYVLVKIRQSITLKERHRTNGPSLPNINERATTLTYNPHTEQDSASVSTSDLHEALQELLKVTYPKVQPEATAAFQKVVLLMRVVHGNKLQHLQRRIAQCDGSCNPAQHATLVRLFEDGLAGCGSVSCQHVLTKSLQQAFIKDDRAHSLLFTLATNSIPDKRTLHNVLKHYKKEKRAQIILPLSIMVNKFHKNSGFDEDEVVVWEIISLLKEDLGDDCRNNEVSNDQLILTLKGIMNIGREVIAAYDKKQQAVEDKIVPAVRQCVSNRAVHHRVAVQALQSLESLDMSEEVQRSLIAILGYSAFPVELRCAIFDVLLRHGNERTISDIIHVMVREEVTQMRAYMSSHISAILQATDAAMLRLQDQLKAALQEHNQHTLLRPQTASSQPLSSYYQDTEEIHEHHMSHTETSIVYSPSSILPSSSKFQVSMEVAGLLVPVVDISLDQEGLDFLGGDGVPGSEAQADFSHFHSMIVKQLELLHDTVHHSHNNPEAALHLRLLGYNVAMISLNDLGFLAGLKAVKSQEDLWSLLRLGTYISSLSNDLAWSYDKALKVPLASEVIPTSLGIPVELTLDTTAVVRAGITAAWQDRKPKTTLDMDDISVTGVVSLTASGETSSRVSVKLGSLVSSGVEQRTSWQLNSDNPVSLTSSNQGIQLKVDNLKHISDIAYYKSNTDVLGKATSSSVLAGPDDQQRSCMFAFIERLTGWDLCPHSSTGITLGHMASMLVSFMWDSLPQPLSDMLKQVIFFSPHSLLINLPLPKQKGSEGQSEGWFAYLQSVWSMIRQTSRPPTYTAMVFADNHIYTFDGKYYKHPGLGEKCAYVLCRDFVDGNFTVLISQSSITVLTRDVAVSVDYNGQVRINNTQHVIDLPMQTWNGHVSVIRQGSYVILNTTYGLHMQCGDEPAGFCLVSVDGHYHNRTLGLLGTNDNEVTNDFRIKNGDIADNVQDFVNSYEVSGLPECRPAMNLAPATPAPICPSDQSASCLQMFDQQRSPMATCFEAVDPKPFMSACEKETSQCGIHVRSSLPCDIADAYRTLCHAKGIHLPPIAACVFCGERPFNSTWKETGQRMSDLVVVTSLNEDMSEGHVLAHYLGRFLHVLHQQFQRAGLSDVRVSLIGYGGGGFHQQPHYLMNSEPFHQLVTEHGELQNLENLLATGNEVASVRDALLMATTLPFRPQAARSVLLITHSYPEMTSDDVHKIHASLESHDVTLNIMSNYDILRPKKRLGLQWNRQLVGAPGTADTAVFEQDPVASLVQESHGTLYDLDKVATGNPHALRLVARQLVDQVTSQTNTCRQCVCSDSHVGLGISQCHRVTCS